MAHFACQLSQAPVPDRAVQVLPRRCSEGEVDSCNLLPLSKGDERTCLALRAGGLGSAA